MSPSARPGFLDRLVSAGRTLLGREERGLPPSNLMMAQNWGVPAQFKPEESLDAYGYNVWLYRSVLTLAMELARVPLKLRFRNKKGDYEYIQKHQALDLLARPQVTKYGKVQLTGMMLKVVTFMHELLNGEAFWVALKRLPPELGGGATMLDLALPQYMRLVKDGDGEISEYVYQVPGAGREEHFAPLDVFHFRIPDPKDWSRGHSPVQSIRYAVDIHRQADEMNTHRLGNYGVPPGVLETEQQIGDLDRRKLQLQWQNAVGGMKNSGKVPVLPQGLHFNKVQDSNQELQMVEGKNVTRDEILANYGVGLEIIGQTDSVTRANAEATIFVFQRFGVLPFLELFVDALTNDYLIAFPNPKEAEFAFDDPVPANAEEKRLTSQTLFDNAGMTPDEMRQEFGREPLKIKGVTDVPYISYSKMRADQEPPDPAPLGL